MNFRSILVLVLLVVFAGNAFGQNCPSCTVDETVHPNTGPEDVGLFPDQVTVQAGVDTTIVIQYLMPTQLTVDAGPPIGVVTASVTSIQVLDIIDLPANTQLSWTCDQIANACVYNPQSYRYGCVTICVNTLAAAGTYSANVLVNGCGTASGITQCQNENIPFTINVLPPVGNPFFSMSANIGCDTVVTDFEETLPAQLPINPVTYAWDFGGLGTATGPTTSFEFIGAGEYEVTLTETIEEYFISALSVTATNSSCYCGDIEEPDLPFIGCTSDPEPYVIVNTGGNNVTLGNNNSNATQNWSGLDIPLVNNAVSVQVWEEDAVSADDNLGSDLDVFNTDPGIGANLFMTNCATGSYTLSSRVLVVNTYTDTVTVLPPSNVPTITNLAGNDTICAGSSIMLESSASDSYQWYMDGTSIQGATAQTLEVSAAGMYMVEVIDAGTICSELAASAFEITVEDIAVPVITLDEVSGELTVDNPDGYMVQWFSNGVPIPGASSNSISDLSSGGPFTVSFTSMNNCETLSAAFDVCIAGTSIQSGVTIDDANAITFTAQDFILKPGNDIAWGISTAADGAIEDMTSLQTAIDAGWVFPNEGAMDLTLDCSDFAGIPNGDYVVTPFSAAVLAIDSLIYNPAMDSGCIPDASLCLEITGTDWAILGSSLTFTFPNGQSVGVLEALVPPDLQGLIPDTITASLLDLLPQFLPDGLCFQLFDLYQGDPNGTWGISAENIGTGAVTVTIPSFTSTVLADSCDLITMDQVVNIPGTSGTITGGSSDELTFTLPPLPANFPTINGDCSVFGTAATFTVDCPDLPDAITTIDEFVNIQLYPNPNNGSFVVSGELTERQAITIQILDVTGRLILNRTYPSEMGLFYEKIDLKNNLSSGFYVFNFVVNNKQVQKHFIVE